jgi:transposase
MVMLAEHYDFVIGGDPDRDTIDLAILEAGTGRVRDQTVDRTDGPAYSRLLSWARQHAPGRRVWALEGTGSFAAGFVTMLAEAGEDIVEIPGQRRSRKAKNDRIDAVQAARTALARTEQAAPRERGLREALRQVLVTRQGVLVSRTKAINELKSLIVVAPEHLRSQLRGLPLAKQLDQIDRLISPVGATVEHRVTISTLRSIAARIGWHPDRRSRRRTVRAPIPTRRRTGAARRTRRRPRRRRSASGQLVPPRPGPQRSRVRLAGWCGPA